MRRSGSMSLHPPPPHLVPPPGGHRIPPPSHPPPYSPLPPPLNKQQQPTHPPVAQVPLLLHRLKIEVNSYEQVKPFRPWEDSRDDQKWLCWLNFLKKIVLLKLFLKQGWKNSCETSLIKLLGASGGACAASWCHTLWSGRHASAGRLVRHILILLRQI